MTPRRLLLFGLLVVTGVLVQTTVLARIPLPGSPPDLVLVVVIACALVEGSRAGVTIGFSAGLFADLQTDHQLGRLALAYLLTGYAAGQVRDDRARSTMLPLAVVGMGALVALFAYLAEGFALGDPRTALSTVGLGSFAAVAYDVVLTPFVVPVVAILLRRVEPDPLRL
ncbi:MAG: mreD [Frankiales bacterium]|nr:mreD [Frankiales bacterium]